MQRLENDVIKERKLREGNQEKIVDRIFNEFEKMTEDFTATVIKKREKSQDDLTLLIKETQKKLMQQIAAERSDRIEMEKQIIDLTTQKLAPP